MENLLPPRLPENYINNPDFVSEQNYNEGENIVFKCPIQGHPLPDIIWQFTSLTGETSFFEPNSRSMPNSVVSRSDSQASANNISYRISVSSSGYQLNLNNLMKIDDGFYTCLADNKLGKLDYQYSLTVNTIPKILLNSENHLSELTFKVDDFVELSCPVSGYPLPEIIWSAAGHFSEDLYNISESNSLTINSLNLDHAGTYTCTVVNTAGSASHNFIIDIQHSPIIEESIFINNTIEVLDGKNLEIPCYITSNPSPIIKWYQEQNLMEVKSIDNSNLIIEIVSPVHEGHWTCLAENSIGQSNLTYYVDVQTAPVLNFDTFSLNYQEFKSQTFQQGEEVVINCPIIADPIPLYTWNDFNGNLISNQQNLKISNARLQDIGEYTCKAMNLHGSITTLVSLNIEKPAEVTFHSNTYVLVDYCTSMKNCRTQLSCTALGNPVPEFTWLKNGQAYQSRKNIPETTQNPENYSATSKLTIFSPGEYACLATNKLGDDRVVMQVEFQIPPNFEFLPIDTFSGFFDASGNYVQEINSIVGTDLEIECPVSGYPRPKVFWLDENEKDLSQDDRFSLNLFNSTATLNLAETTKQDDYFICVSKNLVGETRQIFEVNILVQPEIFIGQYTQNQTHDFVASNQIEVIIDQAQPAKIVCNIVESNPFPEIIWYKNGVEISENDDRYVKSQENQRHVLTLLTFDLSDHESTYTEGGR